MLTPYYIQHAHSILNTDIENNCSIRNVKGKVELNDSTKSDPIMTSRFLITKLTKTLKYHYARKKSSKEQSSLKSYIFNMATMTITKKSTSTWLMLVFKAYVH